MANLPPLDETIKRPSFFSSVRSGITGFVKGSIAGGLLGIISGVLVGAAIAAISLATVANPIGFVAAMGMGAYIGGTSLAFIGAAAGTMTGVVRSREAGQPTANDVVNVAKISFAQGVAVGHNIEHSQQMETSTTHRDRYVKGKETTNMPEQQVLSS